MPELSRFYGLVISINWVDHNPPHFHVRYAGSDAAIAIRRMELLSGNLPNRALNLALEWAALHEKELLENWERARNQTPTRRIAPLD